MSRDKDKVVRWPDDEYPELIHYVLRGPFVVDGIKYEPPYCEGPGVHAIRSMFSIQDDTGGAARLRCSWPPMTEAEDRDWLTHATLPTQFYNRRRS